MQPESTNEQYTYPPAAPVTAVRESDQRPHHLLDDPALSMASSFTDIRPELFQASLYYNDAIHGQHHLRPPLTTGLQRFMYRLHKRVGMVETLAIITLLLLGFFEEPWWCHHNG